MLRLMQAIGLRVCRCLGARQTRPLTRSLSLLSEQDSLGASGGGVPVTSTGPWHIPIACALPLETGEIPIERITQRITRRQACVGPSDSST